MLAAARVPLAIRNVIEAMLPGEVILALDNVAVAALEPRNG